MWRGGGGEGAAASRSGGSSRSGRSGRGGRPSGWRRWLQETCGAGRKRMGGRVGYVGSCMHHYFGTYALIPPGSHGSIGSKPGDPSWINLTSSSIRQVEGVVVQVRVCLQLPQLWAAGAWHEVAEEQVDGVLLVSVGVGVAVEAADGGHQVLGGEGGGIHGGGGHMRTRGSHGGGGHMRTRGSSTGLCSIRLSPSLSSPTPPPRPHPPHLALRRGLPLPLLAVEEDAVGFGAAVLQTDCIAHHLVHGHEDEGQAAI